jgi:hypothetical protein
MQNWIVAFERLHERADPRIGMRKGIFAMRFATVGRNSREASAQAPRNEINRARGVKEARKLGRETAKLRVRFCLL